MESVLDVDRRYDRHATAARDIGVEYFDSDKILTALLERVWT